MVSVIMMIGVGLLVLLFGAWLIIRTGSGE